MHVHVLLSLGAGIVARIPVTGRSLNRMQGNGRIRSSGRSVSIAARRSRWILVTYLLATLDQLTSFPESGGLIRYAGTGRHRLSKTRNVSVAVVPLSDLIGQCGQGDAVAFRALYEREAGRLYGIALRITRQPALAGDALHDTLLQVWQRAARFDAARGTPEVWLASLVRYRAIDIVRKRSRETTGDVLPEAEDQSPGALDALLADQEGRALHRCLSGLDETQRRAILLAFTDGLSHSEIAAHINAPLGTVKSWVRRGLLALKECLSA